MADLRPCTDTVRAGIREQCRYFVTWWDGEYEGNCALEKGHVGDHFDGLSWYNDELDNTDASHSLPA